MGGKDEALAEDLMRSYNYARRFVGVLWEDEHGPVILSQPDFPAEQLDDLAACMLEEAHPSSTRVGRLIGAREVFALTPGHLGKGWFHLGALERSDVQRLIDEGVRPLRSLRHRDFDALVASFRAALELAQQPITRPRSLRERLERFFGSDGVNATRRFERAIRPVASEHVPDERIADFVETAERVTRNQGPSTPELRRLWVQLAKLPRDPVARARSLVGLLRDFAGGDTPHELGRRRTLEAEVRGLDLRSAARRLARLVSTPPGEVPAATWTRTQRRQMLHLALSSRHTTLELPRDPEMLDPLAFIAEGRAGTPELAVLWRRIVKMSPRTVAQSRGLLRDSEFPAALLADAVELGVSACIWQFEEGGGLRLYLDAVRQLNDHPIAGIKPMADWFVRPFASGFSWEPALMLGLLANHRKDPEGLIATLGAVRAAELADFDFADSFTRWDTPVLDPRPEHFDAVGEALDLTVTQLERYVYWRRLAGYDTDFSDTVLKPIRQAEREERELAHLLTMEQTASLTKRVESLQDPERRMLRLESAAKRARNAFDRAMEVLRRESLDAVMDGVTRSTFERLLGRTVRGQLPPRLRSLMMLVAADNIDLDAIRELLEDVLAGRDLAERPANVRWLQQMANRGVDTRRWVRGLDLHLDIGGETVHIQTETDPLHVLEMGSYFDTCLSLESGFNAASTLTNAIDVNKQVLYGRRDDGTVIARKLIAVTNDGSLLGYRTYAFENQPRLDEKLSEAIALFATECGLRCGTSGEPTALHETFWYDDGVMPWRLRPDVKLPEDVPGDETAIAEHAYWRGFEDPEWWHWGASLDEYKWSPLCAAYAFDGRNAGDLPGEARVFLAARGRFDWLASGEVHPYDDLRSVAAVLPAREDAVREFVRAMRGARAATPRSWAELTEVPPALAVLPPAEVVAYVIDHIRLARDLEVECFVDHHDDCLATFAHQTAGVLHASWLRAGDGDVDRLFASRDPLVVQVGVELAQRVASPDIARRVRALFKAEGPTPELVWALGRQADSASIWALKSALETDPSNLEIVAALQTFCPAEAEAARALMQLPESWPGAQMVRDLRLDGAWRGVGHDQLAAAGLELNGEKHRLAYELAVALREAGTETNAVWAQQVDDHPGADVFPPSRVESMRLEDGVFDLEPAAISHALRRFGHGSLGLMAIAHDDDALAPMWKLFDRSVQGHQLVVMRDLFRRVPVGLELERIGKIDDPWQAERLFADNGRLWRRYLDDLACRQQTRNAMGLADVLARQVGPAEFEAIVSEMWQTYEDAFVADAAGIIERLMADWAPDCASYRLMELFIDRVAPHTDIDPTPFVLDKLRADWVLARWNEAKSQ